MRRLFTYVAALSLLLFLATTVFWVKSFQAHNTGISRKLSHRHVPRAPWAGLEWTSSLACEFSDEILLSSHGYVGWGKIHGREDLSPFSSLPLGHAGYLGAELLRHVKPPALGGSSNAPWPHSWGFTFISGADASSAPSTGSGFLSGPISGDPNTTVEYWWIGIPYWFLALVTGVAPARWFWRRLRARKRRLHQISVFIWPSDGRPAHSYSSRIDGYSVLGWSKANMTYWAVSDVGEGDLHELEALL